MRARSGADGETVVGRPCDRTLRVMTKLRNSAIVVAVTATPRVATLAFGTGSRERIGLQWRQPLLDRLRPPPYCVER